MVVRSPAGDRAQGGFTYLGVLLAVALIGLGLTAASEVWTTVARRQKQEQLDFAGQQIAQAIGSYYESTPGVAKQYPKSLEDLLEDRRSAVVRRHLRQVYPNPLGERGQWDLLPSAGGGIAGVAAVIPQGAEKEIARKEYRYP